MSGLSPTLISYNTLLNAYAKLGEWQESLNLMTHLCSGSSVVRPSASSFNTVFCTLGNVASVVEEPDKQVLAARAIGLYSLMAEQHGIHPDTSLFRNMVATFAACHARNVVLQLALLMSQQASSPKVVNWVQGTGHTLDPCTAAAALDALHQEGAWDVAGLVLAACVEGGAAIGPLAIQRLLLSSALAGAWKAVRHVLQGTGGTFPSSKLALNCTIVQTGGCWAYFWDRL
eukprot:gene10634-10792_t